MGLPDCDPEKRMFASRKIFTEAEPYSFWSKNAAID